MLLTEKDYCDKETSDELEKLGYPRYHYDATEVDKIFRIIPLYAAQKWLRTKDIYIYPVIDKYNDNDKVTWQCELFVPYLRNYRIGNGLSYEDAMKAGIKEGVKILEDK